MIHVGDIELNHDGEARAKRIVDMFLDLEAQLQRACARRFERELEDVRDHALVAMASLPKNQKDPEAVAAASVEGAETSKEEEVERSDTKGTAENPDRHRSKGRAGRARSLGEA